MQEQLWQRQALDHAQRSVGRPLASSVMERAAATLGADVFVARIHAGRAADRAARRAGALTFATGHDILSAASSPPSIGWLRITADPA